MSKPPEEVPVRDLLEKQSLKLELLVGEDGLSRLVETPALQKPGLALAGHLESMHPERVQIMGYSEISYLQSLPEDAAGHRVDDLCATGIPCVVLTRSLEAPPYLSAACEASGVPLLRSSLSSEALIGEFSNHLSARLNPSTTVHGVLVDVFGVGILLLGKSGIGKSETALDLVMHGHRLVADDIVEIRRRGYHALYGIGPEIIRHHMEIRGLGILNIKDLFGVSAVRSTKKIELVVELVDWDPHEEYDRLGVDEPTHSILDVEVHKIKLPVRPGRNMTTIIQVAARNQLLKLQGHHSAREFQERLIGAIAESRAAEAVDADVE